MVGHGALVTRVIQRPCNEIYRGTLLNLRLILVSHANDRANSTSIASYDVDPGITGITVNRVEFLDSLLSLDAPMIDASPSIRNREPGHVPRTRGQDEIKHCPTLMNHKRRPRGTQKFFRDDYVVAIRDISK